MSRLRTLRRAVGPTLAAVAVVLADGPSAYAASPLSLVRSVYGPHDFGASVAASGTTLVVGAPEFGTTTPGAAYVVDGVTGAVLHQLVRPIPLAGAGFGVAVAMTGSDVVVGTTIGEAYLYDASTGTMRHALLDPAGDAASEFGRTVAIAGTQVLVGAPAANQGAGAVHVFELATGAFVETLVSPSPTAGAEFGRTLAVSATHIVVGAPAGPIGTGGAGAVHVFDAGTHAWLRTLGDPTGALGTAFGRALATIGADVLVGSTTRNPNDKLLGIVYRFAAASGALLGALEDPNDPEVAAFAGFGAGIAARGPRIFVAAPDGNLLSDQLGVVFVFDGDAPPAILADPADAGLPRFGAALAVVDAGIAVGAPTPGARAVHLYSPCGDGVDDALEQCDDGNAVSGDGCDSDCTPTACGNGIRTAGEECDDGNDVDEDDCKTDCTINVCGDGVTGRLEACDDGNAVEGDGCDSNCRTSVCRGGARVRHARVRIDGLGAPFGDERVTFSGTLVFRASEMPPFDPPARGAQLFVADQNSGVLLNLSYYLDSSIPPGGPGSGCAPFDGWVAGRSGSVFTYRNASGLFAGCHGDAQGLASLRLRIHRARHTIDFAVKTHPKSFTPSTGPVRGVIALEAGAAALAGGECGTRVFQSARCRFDRQGTRMTCR